MSKAEPLAMQAEALRGVEALAGEATATAQLGSTPEHCPACGYATAGLPAQLCPECGAAIPLVPTREQEAMGGHVARGFAFMLAQAVLSRFVSFGCQIALAHLLIPEHFGLVALADTVAIFANLLQLIGIREVLVTRQRKFDLWAPIAFWVTVIIGICTGAAVAAAAPVTAWVFGQNDLMGLMLVMAVSLPLWAFSIVPEAQLQTRLKFRVLAGVAATQSVLTPILTVAFAAMGFGPYSFVLPRPIVGVLRLVMVMRASGLKVGRPAKLGRAKYLIASSSVIFFTSLLLLLVQVGERPILGALVDAHEVGLYFFAYSTSLQIVMMISMNLEQVLFATLARLRGQTERLLRAYLRSSRVLAAVVVPLCVLQAAACKPAVHAIFGSKWFDAVPAMQFLSLAMIFFGVYSPSSAMLQAQRRFKTRLKLAALSAVSYLSFVAIGAVLGLHQTGTPVGAVTGAAAGVLACYGLTCPFWSFIAVRPMGGGFRDVLGIIARPMLCGLLCAGLGWLAGEAIADALSGKTWRGIKLEDWGRLAGIGCVGLTAYLPLARVLMPDEFGEIAFKLINPLRRVSPSAATLLGMLVRQRAERTGPSAVE